MTINIRNSFFDIIFLFIINNNVETQNIASLRCYHIKYLFSFLIGVLDHFSIDLLATEQNVCHR